MQMLKRCLLAIAQRCDVMCGVFMEIVSKCRFYDISRYTRMEVRQPICDIPRLSRWGT